MADGEAMRSPKNPRHAELVSVFIARLTPKLKQHPAPAVCSFDASAQTEGWTLKQVQGDDGIRDVG